MKRQIPFNKALFFIFWVYSVPLLSQKSDSVKTAVTDEVVVHGQMRINDFSTGSKIITIDSAYYRSNTSSSLADLFALNNLLFIKSYGALSSPSLRGTSAGHTAVLWNGFNLQNPMYGQLDLALVPQDFVNNVAVQFGGKSALFGSGAVGGVIHLNNKPIFGTGYTVKASGLIGSFSGFRETGSFNYSGKRYISSVKVFNYSLQNNYPFKNIAEQGQPVINQTNAQQFQKGILVEQYFVPVKNQQLSFRYWYQQNKRHVPPLMMVVSNGAYQTDYFHRLTGEWQKTGNRTLWVIRTAYFNEALNFVVPKSFSDSVSRSHTIIGEAESKMHIASRYQLNLGLNNTFSTASSSSYQHIPSLNRLGLFGSFKSLFLKERLIVTLSIRQELFDRKLLPVTPSLGLEYYFYNPFFVKATASRIYKVPTFNDLYWVPGGNPNLLPESGWTEDLTIGLKHTTKNENFYTIGLTVFNSNINNWIQWLPRSGLVWSPENVMKVWSRGIEANGKAVLNLNKWTFSAEGNFDYTVSTNEKVAVTHENEKGKQLIYVPYNKGSAGFFTSFKGFTLGLIQQYTGFRYTTADNNGYILPAFNITNIQIGKSITFKKIAINISGRINNAGNENYQVLAWRAMPQRNYQLTIDIQFHQPLKTKPSD